jgi:translocator protein
MSTASHTRPTTPRDWLLLVGFLIVVVGVSSAIGILNVPGEWYQSLNKPPFTPPNWLFGPVWTTLYILIAIAGWRTFRAGANTVPMRFWYAQMALNWLWSPLWFGLHWTWPAFVVIVLIFAAIIGFIASSWNRDRVSALLFVPYALWVGFASVLNFSVAVLN